MFIIWNQPVDWAAILLRKILRRLCRKPKLRYLCIVAKDLNAPFPSCQARIPLEFQLLSPVVKEIEERLAHLPAEHRPDIAQRVQEDHRCVVAIHEGKLVFASWTAFGSCYSYFLDREYELSDTEAYLYGAFTLPKFRGKRIYPASNCYRLQLLKEMGYKRELALIEHDNKAAHRMPKQLAYRKAGITGFIEIFGFRLYFHRDHGAFSALTKRYYWRIV
jgi:hypothetical protein